MPNLEQEVDAIIAEENITDATPAVAADEPVVEEPEAPAVEEPAAPVAETPVAETPEEVEPTNLVAPKPVSTATAPVQFDESKAFDEQGNVRPFTEAVNIGEYLSSQIKPVEVVGKDGKTYQFNTIKDVEEQFPEGFEAKNSIEKLRFESAIVANEAKFNSAVDRLHEAEQQYQEYTTSAIETRRSNEAIVSEYRAMAEQGLVPKVGDPNDPNFGESPAVKELNAIMAWKDATNAENAKKGLGQITSLYVAKQLMDAEGSKVEKVDESKRIIQERNEVASLSASPTPDTGKRPVQPDVPLSRLADEIIASEGLR